MLGHVVFGDFRRMVASRAIPFALILAAAAQAETFFWNPSTALLNGGGDVNKTANWSQVNNGGGAWPKSTFDDDFSAATLNPVWTFVDADNDATTGSYNLASHDDSLTLTARGKDVWLTDNEYAGVWREDIKGDFDVSVKVSSLTGNSDGWAKTGIRVTNDHTNFSAGGSFAVVVSAKHGILVQFDSTGTVGDHDFPSTDGVAPLTTVFPVWVRAAKKGGVFYGYYKTTLNAPWTLLRAANPQVKAVDSDIGLFLTSHNPGATATAVFDDFQASGPVPAAPMDLSFSGTSTTADSNARLTANLTSGSIDMTGYTGTFLFGASTLTVTGAKADFSATALIDAGTGGLAFTAAAGTQVFSPAAQGAVFPAIAKSGAGTLQIAARPLTAVSLSISGGVMDLGGLTNQFAGINATGGSFTNMDANDSLIVTGDANFSGLTAFPAAGSVQIRSQSGPGAAQILIFTPGNAAFNNLYLWAIGAAATPARIVTGAGTLQVKGNLILRDEKLAAGVLGILDFQTNNTSVNVDGNLTRVDNGSGAAPSQQLLMGGGTWTVKGNASLSFGNSGSADLSTLELSGATPAVQTLTISNGAAANVKHSGTGTLNLGAALSGSGLTQSAGTLNFNGFDVSVTGNINVINGGAGALIGLGGRDLHAGGNISLAGQAGNLLNLNPGARWTLSAGGTVSADFAAIANSAATAPLQGEASATCTNGGNNTGWNFPPVAADFTKQPGNVTALAGQKAVFSVSVSGYPAPAFAWRKRGDTTVLSREAVYTILSADPAANGAHYYCTINNGFGDVESADGILTVNEPPTITSGPRDSSVVLGSPVSFTVTVAGTPPFKYKWFKGGSAAVLDSVAVLRIAPTSAAQDGDSLYCTVTNAFGSATSKRAALKINFPAKVAVQPQNATVLDGGSARFSVSASGSGTITFAWFRSGAADTLGKDSVFTVKALLANDTAKYFCVVHNAYGQESSQAATLSVVKGVKIIREPVSITVGRGKKAVFTVQAVGGGPLTYKWTRKGDTASLSKDSVYTIDSAKVTDDKSIFTVRVSDKFSADTSLEAVLTVADCDSLFKVETDSLAVDEGRPISLKGFASCADKYQWSVISGPAPRILDPEVLVLAGTAPRVLADSLIVYRFSALYGSNTITKNVKVKVREAIPDPLVTLPAKAPWPGPGPLVIRPVVSNAVALKASAYHPDLHYQWFLSEPLADTAQAGDSLKLSNPTVEGVLDITLCMDNGGEVHCAASEIRIGRASGLAARGFQLGSLVLEENSLYWSVPGRVLIRDVHGRVLWQGHGLAGSRAPLHGDVHRALRQRRAFLEFRP